MDFEHCLCDAASWEHYHISYTRLVEEKKGWFKKPIQTWEEYHYVTPPGMGPDWYPHKYDLSYERPYKGPIWWI